MSTNPASELGSRNGEGARAVEPLTSGTLNTILSSLASSSPAIRERALYAKGGNTGK